MNNIRAETRVLTPAIPRPCFIVFFITTTTLQHYRLMSLTMNVTNKGIRANLCRKIPSQKGRE